MSVYYSHAGITLLLGDVRDCLRELPAESVQTVVTSPPYFALRDYGCEGQIGLEKTPDEYVAVMVDVFREVRRVLRNDGTVWLNLGDSYAGGGRGFGYGSKQDTNKGCDGMPASIVPDGLKPKDLVGIPWRVAFALQADGWYLRSDIIWHKPNPMPESVTDRPTKAHEYLFLLSKSDRYFYDAEAIREPATEASLLRWSQDVASQNGSARANGGAKTNGTMKAVGGPHKDKQRGHSRRHAGFNDRWDLMTREEQSTMGRNKRSVWTIATMPFPDAHFATFPQNLVKPCVLAGTSEAGCCPTCGRAWERVTKPTEEYAKHLGKDWADDEKDIAEGRGHFAAGIGQRRIKRNAPSITASYITLGFRPACQCSPAKAVPCIVLDPFGGSCTTMQVAKELGRHGVAIDLKADYLDMGIKRLQQDVLPLEVSQ